MFIWGGPSINNSTHGQDPSSKYDYNNNYYTYNNSEQSWRNKILRVEFTQISRFVVIAER